MSKETKELEMVRQHVEKLGEFFESVSIFVTYHEEGGERGTIHINMGCGNYFARIGHVKDWIIKEDEATRLGQRNESGQCE